VLGALLVRNVPVGWVGSKEFFFTFQRSSHGFFRIYILLTPVHHTNKSEPERVCPSGQDIVGVCPRIHEIEFCENADRPTTLRVNRPSEFQ
jgi:hypothetical protein